MAQIPYSRAVVDGNYFLSDHLGGFDKDFKNDILSQIPGDSTVYSEYILPHKAKKVYSHLNLKFSAWLFLTGNHIYSVSTEAAGIIHKPLDFQNFVCSFNRSNHMGRHLLVAAMFRRGLFNPKYSSKHFILDAETLTKHKLECPDFFNRQIVSFDFTRPDDHKHNLQALSPLIQDNFMTIVSEAMATNDGLPFVTEKFLYPVANQRLWLAYAPPGYHALLKNVFRFEPYSCFDYSFDNIEDPALRLKTMLDSIRPFAQMTKSQWMNVYEQQLPIIEKNYKHLASLVFYDLVTDMDEVEGPFDTDIFGVPTSLEEIEHYIDRKTKTGRNKMSGPDTEALFEKIKSNLAEQAK